VHRKAERGQWQWREVPAKGGRNGVRREYHVRSLPQETQDALLEKAIETLPVSSAPVPQAKTGALPAVIEDLPAPATLADWQRRTMDARCQILHLIDQLAEVHGLNKAMAKVIAQAKAELLPAHIQCLVPVANARSGGEMGKQTLSRRTLYRWRELKALGVTALSPKEPAKQPLPAWVPYFLKVYRVPQQPSVPEALEQLPFVLPEGMEMPSASQCYRLLNKMSRVEREKGRRTGKDLRALKPFRRRDTSDLMPLDVALCDGHSFKAKVAHPVHGRPFHPEVCAVIDAATRRAIGWSAGLAESAETVADALRHGIQQSGVPLIFYTDPGSGNKAQVNAHPAFGRYARLGIDFKTGIVGNSQARGLVERFQKSCWIRAAKSLPTFTGKDMDGSALYKTTRLLDKDIKAQGRSDLLISWPQFLDLCQQAIDAYNNRAHSELPKITDAGGNRRYMTPNEMWETFTARGWQPDTVTPQELDDLFRPRVQVGTRRGEVRLFGNVYFHKELQHHHGEQVFVEYEPQNGRFVYVRDLDERLICRAEFEANKSSFYPVSAIEKAAEDRADRRRKLKELQIEEIEQERRGVIDIIPQPAVIEARRELEIEMTRPHAAVVDIPMDDRDRYRFWCQLASRVDGGEELEGKEARFFESFSKTRVWRAFREVEQDLAIAK